jgi:hypothetical protein
MFVMNGSLPEKLDPLEQQFSIDLPHEFGGRSKRSEKKLSKSMISIIFKNDTMIRIVAIELMNTIV